MSIEADQITFSYGSRFTLSKASLEVRSGELVAIVGANGSGKTTLLKIISGLLPREGGDLRIDGLSLDSLSSRARARHIAYVPQSHQPVFDFTVQEAVLLGRIPHRGAYAGYESEEDHRAAEEAITLLELEPLRQAPITELSGGELQRVLLARAVAQHAGNLVLDEPTSHLDVAHQVAVLRILSRLCSERGLSIVASIHDLNLAATHCDSIVAISRGRIVAQGTPAEILTRDRLRELFGIDLLVDPGTEGAAPAIRYAPRGTEFPNG